MTQFFNPDAGLDEPNPAIETIIVPRARDLGGFSVRRALPSAQRQMVGPFIFWDQMGPAVFKAGTGIDVRPTRISGSRPSPICSRARSCTATAWAPCSRSIPAR